MNETAVKQTIVKSMKDGGGYARRIEDQYAVGTYDMIIIPFGLPVFTAEVKIIRGSKFEPSPRQYVELKRIQDVAANNGHVIPVVIGWLDGRYYFSPPKRSIPLNDCFSVTDGTPTFHKQIVMYYHSRSMFTGATT